MISADPDLAKQIYPRIGRPSPEGGSVPSMTRCGNGGCRDAARLNAAELQQLGQLLHEAVSNWRTDRGGAAQRP